MTMTLIEGVGDEVTLFFVLALLAVVACLAWWTTRVADRPLRIQTIIVGQRVIHVDERGEPAAAAAGAGAAAGVGAAAAEERAGTEPPGAAEQDPSCEEDEDGDVEVALREDRVRAEEEELRAEERVEGGGTEEDGQVPDEPKQDAAVEDTPQEDAAGSPAEDSEQSGEDSPDGGTECFTIVDPVADPTSDARQQLRQRRLAFMARQAADAAAPAAQGESASPSDSQRTSSDPDGPSASAPESRPDTTERTAAPAEVTPAATATATGQSITVKLKFLNDTQRLVEGSRAEALADFKRRHFPTETAANRIVRLIFNGRVLPDQETLDQCGLYHNCVVHCHVSAEPRPAAGGAAAAGAAPAELDIGVLLYPVLTSVVTLVWGLRLRYPELFSGMAVVLLAVLTVLLACVAAATFLPLERLPGAGAEATPGRQQQRGR